jgi:hypothetical protein
MRVAFVRPIVVGFDVACLSVVSESVVVPEFAVVRSSFPELSCCALSYPSTSTALSLLPASSIVPRPLLLHFCWLILALIFGYLVVVGINALVSIATNELPDMDEVEDLINNDEEEEVEEAEVELVPEPVLAVLVIPVFPLACEEPVAPILRRSVRIAEAQARNAALVSPVLRRSARIQSRPPVSYVGTC